MARQQRAMRTRSLLVQAASTEFDRSGYEGTTLTQINQLAGISMGALTFHFPTKRALAEAVQQQGREQVRDAIADVVAKHRPALATGVALTVTLARLLEENVEVRAAARLARECSRSTWASEWLPVLRDLFRRAQEECGLRPGSDPDALAALAAHLVAGAELQLRDELALRGGAESLAGDSAASPVVQLAQIWRVVLRGIIVKSISEYEQDLV
ncbi:TetR/AcrR family transcriptional regulator [Streptomyces sp. NRRL S-87]|uniref:TetR/AcrR family transcriptional regulator n=1 Tax=Streptomyces sp. NRRL S-87 TaxID=1463920 RepID=UPI0004C12C4B|nr:TetR/AcrR family transcriptional regulator [Streptomyces sp. NRRL S-87]